MNLKIIGGEVWFDGYRVATLARDVPPSLRQQIRDALEKVSLPEAEALPMKEAEDGRS